MIAAFRYGVSGFVKFKEKYNLTLRLTESLSAAHQKATKAEFEA
jgi:hypothetical protein